MENYRSMSCREGRLKMESFNGNNKAAFSYPSNMQDLRSFSTSHASCNTQNPYNVKGSKDQEQRNGDHKSSRRSSSSSSSSSSSARSGVWCLSDPELQRKKRVASYKVYTVEGKMKGSLRKSFRWIKNTCSQVVYAWR